MGRKTWDSLPERFRPLPGRSNIVITRQKDWQAPGALVAHSLDQAMSLCPEPGPLWVIGGAEIYAQALPLASTVVVTEIDMEVQGDAHAPLLGAEWKEMSRQFHPNDGGLSYSFVHYYK
jgi:dihydrofolate reductase